MAFRPDIENQLGFLGRERFFQVSSVFKFRAVFPPINDLDNEVAQALCYTSANQSIPLDHYDPEIELCYKNG